MHWPARPHLDVQVGMTEACGNRGNGAGTTRDGRINICAGLGSG